MNMKEDVLISDVIKSVDEILLDLEVYYLLKHISKNALLEALEKENPKII